MTQPGVSAGRLLGGEAALSRNVDDRINPDLRRLAALCGLERRFVRGEGVWLTTREGV